VPAVIINGILAVAGLLLLTVAADQLVLGSSRLATRLRISPVVVGVVVIGLGTSTPEFLVSGVAAARGDTGIALGNLVGSNILNLTLILGVAALIAPVIVHSTVVRREAPLAAGAVALFALASWVGLGAALGAALLVPMAAALVLLVRWSRTGAEATLALLAWALLRRGLRLTRIEAGALLFAYALTLPLLPGN
jgi:cation:H+ antiporter